MWKGFVIYILILVALPTVLAEHNPEHDTTQETISRFLSAEAQRLIKDEFAVVNEDLRTYQDENFIALDAEMRSTISRAQQQLVIGALGAFLLGGAIVALVMFNIAKKYSYEKFLEKQLEQGTAGFTEGFVKDGQGLDEMYQDVGVQQMQQQDWGYPDQNPTIGQEQGQSFVSNTSELSGWQGTAPYKDGWEWPGGKQ